MNKRTKNISRLKKLSVLKLSSGSLAKRLYFPDGSGFGLRFIVYTVSEGEFKRLSKKYRANTVGHVISKVTDGVIIKLPDSGSLIITPSVTFEIT